MKPWLIVLFILASLIFGFLADSLYAGNAAIEDVESILPQNTSTEIDLPLTLTSGTTNITVSFQHTGPGTIHLAYQADNSDKQFIAENLDRETTAHTLHIPELQPDTSYSIQAMLIDEHGTVHRSEAYSITTDRT